MRHKWLSRTRRAGSGIVRINMPWAAVVGSNPPANPRNPSDPAYWNFPVFDAAIQDAVAHELDVLLMVNGAAPAWAEGHGRPSNVPAGTWKPNAKSYGAFAQAVATRYSGSYGQLPRVRYFQAWSEMNLPHYLNPQYRGKRLRSPVIYRRMLNEFYLGVHAAQQKASVVTGGTAPYGDRPGTGRSRPLAFLRKLLCLRKSLRATRCPTKAHFDVLAHHPIDTVGGPASGALGRDNVSIADFHMIVRTLRAAERQGTLRPRGKRPAWATEIWWESKPPDRVQGVPKKKHARWLAAAVRTLRRQGARVVLNYLIRDQKYTRANRYETTASGVFFHNGKRKPAFRAWRKASR